MDFLNHKNKGGKELAEPPQTKKSFSLSSFLFLTRHLSALTALHTPSLHSLAATPHIKPDWTPGDAHQVPATHPTGGWASIGHGQGRIVTSSAEQPEKIGHAGENSRNLTLIN